MFIDFANEIVNFAGDASQNLLCYVAQCQTWASERWFCIKSEAPSALSSAQRRERIGCGSEADSSVIVSSTMLRNTCSWLIVELLEEWW